MCVFETRGFSVITSEHRRTCGVSFEYGDVCTQENRQEHFPRAFKARRSGHLEQNLGRRAGNHVMLVHEAFAPPNLEIEYPQGLDHMEVLVLGFKFGGLRAYDFLFHYPFITPIYYSSFHFLFRYPYLYPTYYSSFHLGYDTEGETDFLLLLVCG